MKAVMWVNDMGPCNLGEVSISDIPKILEILENTKFYMGNDPELPERVEYQILIHDSKLKPECIEFMVEVKLVNWQGVS